MFKDNAGNYKEVSDRGQRIEYRNNASSLANSISNIHEKIRKDGQQQTDNMRKVKRPASQKGK